MSPQARETLEKAAYTAVGAPVAAIKALSARLSDLRDTIKESRSDMSDDLAKEFENWVAEGERVVNAALERIRRSGTADQARVAGERVKERVSDTMEGVRSEVDRALDIIEPEESLVTIKGVGPGYSERFNEAGIPGINSYLAKTATAEARKAVAEKTGFTTSQLQQWRDQVDLTRVKGVGQSYVDLLHRADVWTMSQLARANAAGIAAAIKKVDVPGMPDQLPGEEQISKWIGEAKKLSKI